MLYLYMFVFVCLFSMKRRHVAYIHNKLKKEYTMSRKEFEMTEAQLGVLMEASKPVPLIMLQCGMPSGAHENANNAWASLGRELHFNHMTVKPVSGKGTRFFTAIPT